MRPKKFERKHYKMTDDEFKRLKYDLELNRNTEWFWEMLGRRYNFIPETVKPWEGMDGQHFTAVSNE